MPSDLVTMQYLASYAGAVAVVYLVVSYLKGFVKMVMPDVWVRVLALLVSGGVQAFVLLTTGKTDPQSIGLGVVNSFLVAFASMGVHQTASDPTATKSSTPPPNTVAPDPPTKAFSA